MVPGKCSAGHSASPWQVRYATLYRVSFEEFALWSRIPPAGVETNWNSGTLARLLAFAIHPSADAGHGVEPDTWKRLITTLGQRVRWNSAGVEWT
jgi:hypothetical protein